MEKQFVKGFRIFSQVLEYLGSELVHHRQGGMECIAAIVEGLGTDVVPFIILIVLSVLRRMSDQVISFNHILNWIICQNRRMTKIVTIF